MKKVNLILIASSIQAQNLFLKSSFSNNVILDTSDIWNPHISGTDLETGYTFPDDLPGNNSENYFNYVITDYTIYSDFVDTKIETVIGYDGNLTKALYIEFKEDDPSHSAYSRVQYMIFGDTNSNDPVQRMNKGYIKYMMKMHIDIDDVDWFLPFELKDTDDDGFRIGLYVYDPDSPTPYWVAKGQYMIDGNLGEDVWQHDNYDIPVPQDEWFELEVFWYAHPDTNEGEFKVAINGEILFNVTNQTKDPDHPNKMYYLMPFKAYGATGYSWITDFEYWDDIPTGNSVFSDPDLEIIVAVKIFLQGPYDSETQRMSDNLRITGNIPLIEPFTNLNFVHVKGGGEITSQEVLDVDGSNAIVDWIFVELRDSDSPETVLATQSALLQRDGDIVSVDGVSKVSFIGELESEVYLVIRHRNHFGVKTLNTYGTNTPITVNFSNSAVPIFGIESMIDFEGTRLMISGDANNDGQVNSLDKNNFWRQENGNPFDYLNTKADFNLDAIVNPVDMNGYWRLNNSKQEQLD